MTTRFDASDHQSGVPGINWDSANERWKVTVRRNGYTQTVGYLTDLEQAKTFQQEAKALNVSEWPALKVKYGLRIRRGRLPKQSALSAPALLPQGNREIIVAAATAPTPILSDDLATLLQAAETADAAAMQAQQTAERANQTALEAMQRAIAVWNKYADALWAHHHSFAFRKSRLGNLNGQGEPEE